MPEAPQHRLEQKRFSVSPESIELMGRAKSIFLDLQQGAPYLEGISFFGSRTKGLEKQDSDLDAIVFYNPYKFPISDENQESQLLAVRNRISKELGVELGDHLGWSQSLGREKTDIDLFRYARFARGLKNIPKDDAAKILSTIPEAQNIFSRFFLGVGDGLYENRKYILDQISQDKDGDEQFSLLMGAMSVFERDNRAGREDVPQYSGLPATVEEARKYFLTEPRAVL